MNNLEEGSRLIREAKRVLFSDAHRALEEGSYNLAVRRSQESVELLLKGMLRVLGIEYPKVHDVGELFTLQISQKFPQVHREVLEKIDAISMRLSRDREPSFYFERLYTLEDGKRAVEDARFALEFVEGLLLGQG